MDDIDDSVLKELQLSIQAIESSLKDDDYGEHAAPSKQRPFGDDYHYDDDEDEDEDDAEGDYDHDDDYDDDYDIDPEDEGEDPASSEAELAAMMDGLVAELQAEIQEQILQDHLGGGGGDEQEGGDHRPITTTEEEDDDDKFKSSPAYDGGGDDGDDIPSLAYEHLETPRRNDEESTYVDDKDCYAQSAPNVPHLDIPSTTPTNISQGGDDDGDHNRHHVEQEVPVSDYTASPAAPPLVYEQVQSPRKDEPDYVPVADYTKPKLTTQSSNNRNKESSSSSSSSQRSVLLQRFIRYLSSDASPTTKNKAANTNPVPSNMIHHQELQDEEEAACPSTDDGVEDVRFEKINGVSAQDPDYAPVQDYTMGGASSPKKQRRGKREKAGGATPLTSTSTSSTKSNREEAMTQELHELLSAGVLVEEHPTTSTSSTTQHEGKSNSHHQYHGQHPLSNNKPRKRRTNKHLKRGRVEKMLVESLMNDHNGNNNQTTGGRRTKDEAIRLVAESKLWNIICQQAFVGSSK